MADEFKTSQMLSKDADPINIKRKDEVFLDSVDVLGTEGVVNQQAGRKPGRGSKRLSKLEAETGLMYRSDTKTRVIAGSGSTLFKSASDVKILISKHATPSIIYLWIFIDIFVIYPFNHYSEVK